MKKSFMVLGLLFGTGITPATLATDADPAISLTPARFEAVSTDNGVVAASGCCKKRKSESSPWRKDHTNFDRCKKENASEKDNVFKPKGFVWWDAAC